MNEQGRNMKNTSYLETLGSFVQYRLNDQLCKFMLKQKLDREEAHP